jgi:uncharacterized protein (TIGR03435 family)
MVKAHLLGAVGLVAVLGAVLTAQAPASPAFEVASVKLNTSGDAASGTHNMPGGRVNIINERLRDVIRTAYGSNDIEVVGGPDWVGVDRWDILAAAPPGSPDASWDLMLKSLLVERFQLQAHVEPREQPIFRLVFARSDKRLGPALHDTACRDDVPDCGSTSAHTSGIQSGTITGVGRTMAALGTTLSRYAERRVFDQTGLEGRYDFQLQWSEDLSIFTALQEQLGLRLEPARGPVDVVVIDHVEHPTPD